MFIILLARIFGQLVFQKLNHLNKLMLYVFLTSNMVCSTICYLTLTSEQIDTVCISYVRHGLLYNSAKSNLFRTMLFDQEAYRRAFCSSRLPSCSRQKLLNV